MSTRRIAPFLLALVVALGLLPLSPASAARNKPPRIKKAVMKDTNGNGLANKVVLTYNERINHRVDRSRFPFRIQGYKIKRVNKARRALKLVIVVRPTAKAKPRPDFIRYSRTRRQPVKDLKGLQARKQLLTKNIIGVPLPTIPQHRLTVSKSGDGSVTSNPAGIECGSSCTSEFGDFDEGTEVVLTAAPGPDSAPEATWNGCASSTATTCTVTMDAAKTVDVLFAAAGSRTLSVANEGDGDGTVTSSPAGVDCGSTCAASFDDSVTLVTLTATPAEGSKLASWGGDALCPASSTSCDILMDGNKTVTVTFELLPVHTLAVTLDATGTGTGTVTASDGKIACPPTCSADYPEATVVTLTASPSSGSTFAGWGGDAGCGTSLSCQITMSAAKSVSAKFDQEETTTTPTPTKYTIALTITRDGTDGGKVTCMVGATSTPCNSEFDPGTTVTLTASWDLTTTSFDGWTGDCGSFSVLPTCSVTMDADKTVGAKFSGALLSL